MKQIIKEWKKHRNIIPVGIDDWIEKYGHIFSDDDIFIKSDDDVFDLMDKHEISLKEGGMILTVAWHIGAIDQEYNNLPNPKQAIPIGTGQHIHLIMRRHIKEVELKNGKRVRYRTHIAPPNKPPEKRENDQLRNVTHISHVPNNHYVNALTDQGIANVKAYLEKTIPGHIRNRLTQLAIAEQDYKAEARKLKKVIDKIVKELE